MPTTSNFGWTTPADTDLVKDGASAIRTLGNGIDTSLVDLKGGTTGQILSKASNTDLDYTWINNDVGDITEVSAGTGISVASGTGPIPIVTNSMATAIDAKGDLIAGTGSDAFTRLAVGSDGDSLVADSTTATGLRWFTDWNVGKNKILNGDFGIWQRGTSFTAGGYTADRWRMNLGAGNTATTSRQSFTVGSAPVTGYEAPFFLRFDRTVTAAASTILQRIENVRTFANQTITLSFWAKASTSITIAANNIYAYQNFGTGGSSAVTTNFNTSSQAISTSWQRYSFTIALPSISGKTIGTDDHLEIAFNFTSALGNVTFDLWGVQLEPGSVATAFTLSSGSVQGELAACQRYYYRLANLAAGDSIANGFQTATNIHRGLILFPVTMRTAPTAIEQSGTASDYRVRTGGSTANGSVVITFASATRHSITFTMTTGVIGAVGYGLTFEAVNTSAYLGWSAEL